MSNPSYISKEQLYDMLEDIPVPIILTETDKTIRYANKKALHLGNYKWLTGKKCNETFCNDEDCLCNNVQPENEQQFFLRNDGTKIPVFTKSHLLHFNQDNFYVNFITDLTERLEHENRLKNIIAEKSNARQDALKESKKFEAIIEGVSDAIFMHDMKGRILKVNIRACEQLGYSREELESMNLEDIVSRKIAKRPKERITNLVGNKTIVFESIHLTKNGKEIPVEIYQINVVDFEGSKVIMGTARDISLRKSYEQQLLEMKSIAENNEAELKTIFNKVPSAIVIFDDEAQVLRVNEIGKVLFGLNDDYKSQRIGDIINCSNTQNKTIKCGSGKLCAQCQLTNIFNDVIEKSVETNKKELQLQLLKNGEVADYTLLLSTAILHKNGKSKFILTLDDITDRKKMENELLLAKEKAELSEKLKTAFLNNISHEIRTPLNGMLGFLDLFENDFDQTPKEERKSFIDIMRKSGDRLVNTVTDIIEASKLDSGIIEIAHENFDLENTFSDFQEEFQNKYSSHLIQYNLQIDPKLKSSQIKTDKSKLLRVVKYLLDNAFKFTLKGSVTLEVKLFDSDLMFSVEDTGIGISPNHLKIIFEPFRQVDMELSRAFDGNGLGLTIASKLVKYLGGELLVESEPDKGSRFYFTLQNVFSENVKPAASVIRTSSLDSVMTGKTILIAEDDEINYMFLQAVLEKKGCRLIHAQNGKEAVELFTKNSDIDLIIMDLKMPVMNGIDATFKIKKINNTIPVIAHSAYVLNNEKEQSLAAGCADYLPKPVKVEDLILTLEKHLFHKN